MLILSRRLNEKIFIPSLGVTVEIVGLKGKTVKLGIAAPHDVKVLRAEIAADLPVLVAPAAPHKSCRADSSGHTRLRALVVEDDHNQRELLAGLLHMNGCECHTAGDGLEALDYLAAHDRPDLVLLDWLMPRCDGRQTLTRIRDDQRLRGLKVFAVGGTRPEDAGVNTGPGGVDAWFPKPLNTRRLWDAIRTEFATSIRAD
ncbi:MAG: response regulator [Gemmataceae bacterium]